MDEGADPTTHAWFELFTEVGIIAQLSRALFEARLEGGLSLPQFSVLNHMVRLGDGWTPLRLARAFQVPKTSMTHTLGLLEAAGLAELRANPEDGRSKLVFITEAGRAAREAAIASLSEDVARLAKKAEPGTVAALVPGLRALRQMLDQDRPEQ